jgi:hypothetical protein
MGGGRSCVFVGTSELSGDLFDRFYHAVLAPAFPPDELEDIETVRALYFGPSARVPGLVALRAGDPVGGTLGEHYHDSNVVIPCYQAYRQGDSESARHALNLPGSGARIRTQAHRAGLSR